LNKKYHIEALLLKLLIVVEKLKVFLEVDLMKKIKLDNVLIKF